MNKCCNNIIPEHGRYLDLHGAEKVVGALVGAIKNGKVIAGKSKAEGIQGIINKDNLPFDPDAIDANMHSLSVSISKLATKEQFTSLERLLLYTEVGLKGEILAVKNSIPVPCDLTPYLTRNEANRAYQPKGNYLVKSDLNDYVKRGEVLDHVVLDEYALKSDIPDVSNFALKTLIPDISGLALKSEIPSLQGYALKSEIPNVSEFANKSDISNIRSNISDIRNQISGIDMDGGIIKFNTQYSYIDFDGKELITVTAGNDNKDGEMLFTTPLILMPESNLTVRNISLPVIDDIEGVSGFSDGKDGLIITHINGVATWSSPTNNSNTVILTETEEYPAAVVFNNSEAIVGVEGGVRFETPSVHMEDSSLSVRLINLPNIDKEVEGIDGFSCGKDGDVITKVNGVTTWGDICDTRCGKIIYSKIEDLYSSVSKIKDNNYIIPESAITVTYTEEKGSGIYSTSENYTNIEISKEYVDNNKFEWVDGAIYTFVTMSTIGKTGYNNGRVKIEGELFWHPICKTSGAIGLVSSYLTNTKTYLFVFKKQFGDDGALCVHVDTTYTLIPIYSGSKNITISANGYGANKSLVFLTNNVVSNDRWSSLVKSSSTASTKDVVTSTFYINRTPLYITENILANKTSVGTSYISYSSLDLRYTHNAKSYMVSPYKRVFLYMPNFEEETFSFEQNEQLYAEIISEDNIYDLLNDCGCESVYLYYMGYSTSTWYTCYPNPTEQNRVYKYTFDSNDMLPINFNTSKIDLNSQKIRSIEELISNIQIGGSSELYNGNTIMLNETIDYPAAVVFNDTEAIIGTRDIVNNVSGISFETPNVYMKNSALYTKQLYLPVIDEEVGGISGFSCGKDGLVVSKTDGILTWSDAQLQSSSPSVEGLDDVYSRLLELENNINGNINIVSTKEDGFYISDAQGNCISYVNSDGTFGFSDKKSFKLLGIGNSFTIDAFAYLPKLLDDIIPEYDYTIGIVYKGSCDLSTHLSNMNNNSAAYTYYEWNKGDTAWSSKSSQSINNIVKFNKWEFITLQQVSSQTYNKSSYSTIPDIVSWMFNNINYSFKLGWLMSKRRLDVSVDTWLNGSIEAINENVNTKNPFLFVLPVGIAIENGRTNSTLKSLGNSGYMSADSLHSQEGIGCLLEAYCVCQSLLDILNIGNKSIFGNKVMDIDIDQMNVPDKQGSFVGVDSNNCFIAQKAAIEACKNPLVITNI